MLTLISNFDWIFSGIGVLVITAIVRYFKDMERT